MHALSVLLGTVVARSNRRFLLPAPYFAFGGTCDRKDFTDILRKCLAKALRVRWQWSTLVPLDCKPFSNRLAMMRYTDNSQLVAIRWQERCNDGNALAGFRQREQRVGCATLEQNIRLNVRKTAGGIEQPADGVA